MFFAKEKKIRMSLIRIFLFPLKSWDSISVFTHPLHLIHFLNLPLCMFRECRQIDKDRLMSAEGRMLAYQINSSPYFSCTSLIYLRINADESSFLHIISTLPFSATI